MNEIQGIGFLHTTCLVTLKGFVDLIVAKDSVMRISIPLDLSSLSFIPPRFIRVRTWWVFIFAILAFDWLFCSKKGLC